MSSQKGIMMCERPGPSGLDAAPGLKPFLPSSSTSGMEPLGLVPPHKTFPPSLAKKPENIPARNRALLHNLEDEVKQAALREEEARVAAAKKAESVTVFNAQLRTAILSGEDVSFWRATKRTEGTRQSLGTAGASPSQTQPSPRDASNAQPATASEKAAMQSFVDDVIKEATGALEAAASSGPAAAPPAAPDPQPQQRTDGTAEASTSGGGGVAFAIPAVAAAPAASRPGTSGSGAARAGKGGGARGPGSKPAWALSSEEVSKLEDAEEEELLRFADELDFDSFMAALDDVELQETVNKALQGEGGRGPAPGEEKAWKRQLVAAMNHAAMKRVAAARQTAGPRDDDGASVAVGSEGGATALSRAAAASRVRAELAARGDKGWDASSRASAEDVARMERAKAATQEAADFLRENPELRSVHSSASVRAMISKAGPQAATLAGAAAS